MKKSKPTTVLQLLRELKRINAMLTKDRSKEIADRDNWKAKALAYRDIIERAKAVCHEIRTSLILNETDKLDKRSNEQTFDGRADGAEVF
jgi:hypothetical protein